jgi:TolB protein
MTIRRILWIAIPLLVVVVLAGGGALAWLVFVGRSAEPVWLVVIGDDSRVRLLGENGAERVLAENALTQDYSFPATSPDRRRIAYVARENDQSAIMLYDLASGERKELYHSQTNIPIDLAWSPDGKYIVFLIGSELTAQIVPTDGSRPAQLIAAGAPSFFAWSPDSATLLLHLGGHTAQGGQVSTFRPGQQQASPLLSDPGLFQAPAWSLDGSHFFYVAQPPITSTTPSVEDIKSDIMRVSADGKDPVMLVREEKADLRIIRAPNSDQIAYMVVGINGFGPLKLIDGVGGPVRVLSREGEHVTAFFWSPDGKQIAYLTHDGEFTLQGKRTWHVVDAVNGAIRDFDTFQPSAAFAGLQVFFDAYTFSFSPWSPEGMRLAYGADDGVYLIDLAAGTTAKKADGTLGMWVGGR